MELGEQNYKAKGCTLGCSADYVTPPTVQGWVWSLTSDPQRPQLLYSGSWDASVRVWDVTVAKDVANIA